VPTTALIAAAQKRGEAIKARRTIIMAERLPQCGGKTGKPDWIAGALSYPDTANGFVIKKVVSRQGFCLCKYYQ